jgi:hypothetical protein
MGASRPGGVVAFARADQTLGGAVAAFLAQPDLAASTPARTSRLSTGLSARSAAISRPPSSPATR